MAKETKNKKAVEKDREQSKSTKETKIKEPRSDAEKKSAHKSTGTGKKTSRKSPSYKEEYEALHDKYLRLSAEFDNFRKRTLKEKADLTKFAGENLLLGLLPVVDDFERALELIPDEESVKAIREGTVLIYNKLKDFLRQNGVEEIDALHQEFDTDIHDAVTKIPAPDKKLKGKIVDVIQKGYFLNGKVLRYAKVVIGE